MKIKIKFLKYIYSNINSFIKTVITTNFSTLSLQFVYALGMVLNSLFNFFVVWYIESYELHIFNKFGTIQLCSEPHLFWLN